LSETPADPPEAQTLDAAGANANARGTLPAGAGGRATCQLVPCGAGGGAARERNVKKNVKKVKGER
jgi:hypothetical protein